MKIVIRAVIGGKEKEFEIPCGEGDKSFKWLSNCATQRFALASPNGKLRRKESLRGETFNSQSTCFNIVLPNGETPHPSSLICDFVGDGDVITMELVDIVNVNTTGMAAQSDWATLAFSTSSVGESKEDLFLEGDGGEMKEEDQVDMGKALFMANILSSQAPNKTGILESLDDAWEYVDKLMPKLSSVQTMELKALFAKHWPILMELYQNYAPLNAMMKREMTETDYFHFVEDAEVFSVRDFEFLTKRSFRRVSAGDRTLSIGAFVSATIFLAQARHVDIFSKESPDLPDAVNAVKIIIEKNLLGLALKLNSNAYFRFCFFGDKFLASLRSMHENLFLVFEKYCAKITREVTTNLPSDLVAQLFVDAKITPALDPFYVSELLSTCRAGLINGRYFPKDVSFILPPEDGFQFAEFIEAIARSAFRNEGSLEVAVVNKVVNEAMLENLKLVESLLWYKPEEASVQTKGKK